MLRKDIKSVCGNSVQHILMLCSDEMSRRFLKYDGLKISFFSLADLLMGDDNVIDLTYHSLRYYEFVMKREYCGWFARDKH